MIGLHCENAKYFIEKLYANNKIDTKGDYFLTFAANDIVINLRKEGNIISFGNYRFSNNEIYPDIEFVLFLKGNLFIPFEMLIDDLEFSSGFVDGLLLKHKNSKNSADIKNILEKYLYKILNYDLKLTDEIKI